MSQRDWDELEKEKQNIIDGKSVTRLWTVQDIFEQSENHSEDGKVCIEEVDALRILDAISIPDCDFSEYDIINDMISDCT
jgi:hypothetical protein